MKCEAGEVMALVCEDGDHDQLFVRGHMSTGEATELLLEHYGEDYVFDMPEQAYGRWSMEAGPDGPQQYLRVYDKPGRGRFSVMVANVKGGN